VDEVKQMQLVWIRSPFPEIIEVCMSRDHETMVVEITPIIAKNMLLDLAKIIRDMGKREGEVL